MKLIARILLGLIVWAFASMATAATLLATPATYPAIWKAAGAGDTVTFAGAFGDVYLGSKTASPPILVINADPLNPASLRTLTIQGVTGLRVTGLDIDFTPDLKTTSATQAVTVDGSADVVLDGLKVIGGPAINGVPDTATALDKTDNVIGLPTGRGVGISNSHDVSLVNSEVANFHRLGFLHVVRNILIQHNDFHDRRTTAWVGANLTGVVVDGNVIRAAIPWRWGLPNGDHADTLAFWSDPGQTTPNARVSVTNNIMVQTSGAAILGMWEQGNAPTLAVPQGAPFVGSVVAGNFIGVPNLQGVLETYSVSGSITGNTLVQIPVASMAADQVDRQFPTILLRAGVANMTSTGNGLGAPYDDQSLGLRIPNPTNTASGNTLTKPSKDGGVTEIKAWLVAHPDMVALAGPLLPKPVVPVDPRDAQIADLTAKLSAASGWADLYKAQLADAKAANVVELAEVSDLQAHLAEAQDLVASLNTSLAAANDNLAADKTKMDGARAALGPSN